MITPDVLTTQGIAWIDAIAKVATECLTQVGVLAGLAYLTYDKMVSKKAMTDRIERVADTARMALAQSVPTASTPDSTQDAAATLPPGATQTTSTEKTETTTQVP